MERKIIKQGGGGHTIYLPKKWIDAQKIKSGDSIIITEKESTLIISNKNYKIPEKKINISITKEKFHTYRGILGGLYRAGYQTININFDDNSVIPLLEKAISSLFGFEILNIKTKTCTIKSMYRESETNIEQYIQKMIHTANLMHEIILENIKNKTTHKAKEEIFQYRTNVLKYRDLVLRTITQLKLIEDEQFPYYQIAISLWNIVRNYNQLYQIIEIKDILKKDMDILINTSKYVKESFSKISKRNIFIRFEKYEKLRNEIQKRLKSKESSLIAAYCLNITIATHSADSSIAILNLNKLRS